MAVLSKLVRDARRGGPLRLVADSARRRWKRTFDDRIVVWEWRPGIDGPTSAAFLPAGGEFRLDRYDTPEQVPSAFFHAVESEEGAGALNRFYGEFADAGVLWVPWLAGRPCGYQ